MDNQPTGVLLLNMGGPEKLEDVPAFLYNLFSDRDIIKLGPPFMQKVLAWLIARRRAPKSQEMYSKIGGGSPLRRITEQQANRLGVILQEDGHYLVQVAMRYWQPRAQEALTTLIDNGAQRLIAVSLYPHYSRATAGSSLADMRSAQQRLAPHIPLLEIPSWPDQPRYIEALAANIEQGLAQFDTSEVEIVYSAHSLPVSFINDGDPYVQELHTTIKALELRTGRTGRLCYQSRSGPVEWLSPATSDTLHTLAREGCRNILMVPISFVSDHIETLYEINMLFKEQAAALNMRLIPSASLNLQPTFIQCLKELVLSAS